MSISAPSTIGGNQVPLNQLSPLLGDRTETLLSSQRLANQAAWTDGFRLTGQKVDVAVHDSIRIAVVESGGDIAEEWSITVDEWKALPERSVGDDLAVSGRSEILRSDTGTIRIGRSGGNRVLLQLGTYTTALANFNLNGYARSYDGGLLERRVSPARSHPVRDTVLKIRSATTPAAPVGVTFDSNGYATPGSDGWVLSTDPDPAGSDPLWLAAAHNPYDADTETYSPEGWIVTQGGSSFRQQWAEDDSGPWQDTPPTGARLVTRVRVNGAWQTYVVRDDTDAGWVWFCVATLAANGSPHTIELDHTDWSDFKWIEFIMRQNDGTNNGNRRSVVVPADHVTGMGATVDLTSRYTLNMLLSETGQGWTQGGTDNLTSLGVANLHAQVLQVRAYGAAHGRSQGTHLRVDLGFNDYNVAFVMRGIR